MRLIDADELQMKLRKLDWQDLYLPVHFDNMIAECETIKEHRKGKWLWGDGIRCSNCYYKLQTTGLPSRCPNCGADMREEKADD